MPANLITPKSQQKGEVLVGYVPLIDINAASSQEQTIDHFKGHVLHLNESDRYGFWSRLSPNGDGWSNDYEDTCLDEDGCLSVPELDEDEFVESCYGVLVFQDREDALRALGTHDQDVLGIVTIEGMCVDATGEMGDRRSEDIKIWRAQKVRVRRIVYTGRPYFDSWGTNWEFYHGRQRTSQEFNAEFFRLRYGLDQAVLLPPFETPSPEARKYHNLFIADELTTPVLSLCTLAFAGALALGAAPTIMAGAFALLAAAALTIKSSARRARRRSYLQDDELLPRVVDYHARAVRQKAEKEQIATLPFVDA